jgi:hypothetical protein
MAISVNHLILDTDLGVPVGSVVGTDDDTDVAAAAGVGVPCWPFKIWRRVITMLYIAELSGGVSEPGVPGVYKFHGPSGNRTYADTSRHLPHSCTTTWCIDAY